MPKDLTKLDIQIPDFGDSSVLLKALGKIVVDEIITMIAREEQPDGSPQKRNSPGYEDAKARMKGYRTPLWGIEGAAVKLAGGKARAKGGIRGKSSGIVSPYLGRPGGPAFLRTFIPPASIKIHLNNKREEIGKELQRRGYLFMGITEEAQRKIGEKTVIYFKTKIRQLVRENTRGS